MVVGNNGDGHLAGLLLGGSGGLSLWQDPGQRRGAQSHQPELRRRVGRPAELLREGSSLEDALTQATSGSVEQVSQHLSLSGTTLGPGRDLADGLGDAGYLRERVRRRWAAMRRFQYDPSPSFSGWLKTVTHNTLNDFCNDRRKEHGQIAVNISIAELGAAAPTRRNSNKGWRVSSIATCSKTAVRRSKNASSRSPGTRFDSRPSKVSPAGCRGTFEDPRREHVFVARNHVQKLLQEEIRFMKGNKT